MRHTLGLRNHEKDQEETGAETLTGGQEDQGAGNRLDDQRRVSRGGSRGAEGGVDDFSTPDASVAQEEVRWELCGGLVIRTGGSGLSAETGR